MVASLREISRGLVTVDDCPQLRGLRQEIAALIFRVEAQAEVIDQANRVIQVARDRSKRGRELYQPPPNPLYKEK